ncbi:Formate dehydrogenase chain D [Methanosarcina barkeri str. Wiesmoor]|uniref:Formate dehydrogenase chain D n=1 Tax=Methanosarcina barkeri str. Wiesmoor TaxID=1434109 RepID=A0A0E3QIR3_METBA|nr:formate dehydrogenase accessory sulfurtransferase FdhD [Methanosarcina barkeri]AKB50664.1 Formate dehydrogenase chain D [Methanosarcina barkeri str. Wiesmoor]
MWRRSLIFGYGPAPENPVGLVTDVSTIKTNERNIDLRPLYQNKRDTYCRTFGPEGKICVIEDIGRHNVLDKAIGYGLKYGVDFSRTIVTCQGRLSSEMVRKCLMANIPVIVSRSATTTLAISMVEQAGLTIIGFARNQK